ncbi:MAG: PIN domain-containing protein [Kiritimatiellia bacterium]
MTAWAFIDHENVPDFEHLNINDYERILLFCGPRSKKLKIDPLSDTTFHRFEILRISTTGKNNLDFHLAFHLGRLHTEAGPGIAFHIISKDQGYDGLIHHLKNLKRTCKRVEPQQPQPKLSQDAERIVTLLNKTPATNRPSSEKSLLSWINNIFQNRKTPPKAENLIKKLKAAKLLTIQDGKVTYTLEKP